MKEHELYFNFKKTIVDDEYNKWEITQMKRKIEIEPQLRELLIKSDEDTKSKGTVRINKHLLEAFKVYTNHMDININVLLHSFIKDYILNNERAKGYFQ
jgi:hypothetical protein